jgi:hydroxymethylglutaryl-CoA lyase
MTLSEVKLGLCPATISKYVIREYGLQFAREAMLSARPVKAEELLARGIFCDVASDAKQLAEKLSALLQRLKSASPEASRMSKELIRLAWAHGGSEDQAIGIRALFDEMMRPDSPGGFGVKEFQSGRKVDWDAYTLRQAEVKAKL